MDEENNSVNKNNLSKKGSFVKMHETSSEESARESSSCCKDWSDSSSSPEDSTLNMCMSPPKSRTKRSNSRKKPHHRNVSKKSAKNQENRNPSLIHSAEFLKNDQNISHISDFHISQEPFSTLNSTNETAEFNAKTERVNCSTTDSNSEIVSKTTTKSFKKIYECRIKKSSNNEIDPLDRAESINKISLLLKLALRPRIQNKDLKLVNSITNVPPSTPSSSLK